MATKIFELQFGTGDPRPFTGLTPTFILFYSNVDGTVLTAPGITELVAGTGQYKFQYGPTISISFLADGGSGLASSDRYINGVLDPVLAIDQVIGQPYDSFGSTGIDPSTVIGYSKRNLEYNEGNAVFNKSTGVWDVYSRGSSTMLFEKQLANNTSQATKV